MKIIEKIKEREKFFRRAKREGPHLQQPPSSLTHDPEVSPGAAAPLIPPSFWSFEFFPPKTEAGMENLLTRIERMSRRLDPLFIDVTFTHRTKTLAVARHAQKYLGVHVLLHLTCQQMNREEILQILQESKDSGIRNILALRGDPPLGKQSWGVGDVSEGYCARAIDLVKLIREVHGDYFCIAVAGHPEGHPASTTREDELRHLKEKIDAGADFILSQLFYDASKFLNFVKECRQHGINVPIIPGIMPIQSYRTFQRMTKYCQIEVPEELWQRLEPVKTNDDAVKEIGCAVAVEMCQRILREGDGGGLHFYTLNLERSVTKILLDMGAVGVVQPQREETNAITASTSDQYGNIRSYVGRTLPWRPSTIDGRSEREQVRPINWANRPKSYVQRTETWDEFPNGRWGDATSPAFGELSELSHFYSFSLGSEDDQRAILGREPVREEDVFEVFASYVEGKIPYLPWCETPLSTESFHIQTILAKLNRCGFLTINSQPAVNGAPSTDKSFGWGIPGGYVYQKAYCECFCSSERVQLLLEKVSKFNSLQMYAVNNAGEELGREGEEDTQGGVTALTWGVFPNREILQPTVFDPSTFLIWSEEAFSLWTTMWSNLYDFDSDSFELIENIRDSYYLVALIDNDYVNASSDSPIWQALLSCFE